MSGELVIVRHADTDWTASGQHTGRTDIPLNADGRAKAGSLRERLAGRRFVAVWSSPLRRALETAMLAGFEPSERDDLMEWDYGDYEGLTSAQIREHRPGWDLWRDGCPGGETAADVGRRAEAVLAALPAGGGVDRSPFVPRVPPGKSPVRARVNCPGGTPKSHRLGEFTLIFDRFIALDALE